MEIKMNRFNILIESVLEEAKIDDAIKKASLSPTQTVQALWVYDAIGKKPKFVDFIVQNTKTPSIELSRLILFFINNSPRLTEKDINKYTVESLKSKMEELGKSKSEKSDEISKDAPIVWESPDKTIIIRNILTWEASKKYGAGTKWCITNKESSYHWDNYTNTQLYDFYFIHSTKKPVTDPFYKLPVVVSSNGKINSIYDAPDTNIISDALDYIKGCKIPLSIFKPTDFSKYTTEDFLKKAISGKYTIQPDGSYYIEGNVTISSHLVKDNKLKIKINAITGDFLLRGLKVTSLEGCPKTIGGRCDISNNSLTSLAHGPISVGGSLDISYNSLTTLKDASFKQVGGSISLVANQLTSLEGMTEAFQNCMGIQLLSNNLTSLKGLPEIINNLICCCNNQITSLDGLPKEIKGTLCFSGNPYKPTREEILAVCKINRGNIRLG